MTITIDATDIDRIRGAELRINKYTTRDVDGELMFTNLKVHGTDHVGLDFAPTDYLPDSQSYVARFAFGRDGITFFTDDPMRFAEVLSAMADALRDEYWHQTQAVSA